MMPGTVNKLNAQAALAHGTWSPFDNAHRSPRPASSPAGLAQFVTDHVEAAIHGTHRCVDMWLDASFGTGQRPARSDRLRTAHRPNPGTIGHASPLQSAIVAACFAPPIAVAYLPIAWCLGFGAAATISGFTLAAAVVAAALQLAQGAERTMPWLEDASGLVTAGAKATTTSMAAVAGAWFGLFQWVSAAAGWSPLTGTPNFRQ
jgi:hypothetical protein